MSFKYKDKTISGSGGGLTEESYSEEEIRIGTWIDGEPLYRKAYQFTCPGSKGRYDLGSFSSNFDIKVVYGILYQIQATVPIPYYYDTNDYVGLFANTDGFVFRINVQSSSSCNSPMVVIIEYTKKSDQNTDSNIKESSHQSKTDPFFNSTATIATSSFII